jgi:ribosomal protein S18 acetylase RimI-like enzyme
MTMTYAKTEALAKPSPRKVTSVEQEIAIATLVLAFSNDPAVRWLFPDTHRYLIYFPQFVKAFAGKAFEQGTAYVSGDFTGTALWLAPGVQPHAEPLEELLQSSLPNANQPDAFAVFEQMDHCHPRFPHWYLPLIGVDPQYQGKGHGSVLLRSVLRQCDKEQIPAYLESSNPANIALYERHGFETIGTIQVGRSPEIVPMIRQPQTVTSR